MSRCTLARARRFHALSICTVLVLVVAPTARGAVHYVNATATGANDGTSWADAFVSLQSALEVAQAGDQIWVAAGVYKPTAREDPGDPRSATFRLLSGVKVYGGFAGTETALSQRQIDVNVTTLSGDLAGDDGSDFENYGENVYHLLRGEGTDRSARLDGFTVSGGNDSRPYGYQLDVGQGGGLLINQPPGYLTIADCMFVRNRASVGGGIFVLKGNPTLYGCTFLGNVASVWGGGVGCNDDEQSAPLVLNCRFLGNRADRKGGGFGCGENAGAFLVNCIFSGNIAGISGGGFYGFEPVCPRLVNCTFSRNHAEIKGGGVDIARVVNNCIFWGNTAGGATGMAAQISETYTFFHCCVQDWGSPPFGFGNIALDPLFRDPLGPDGIAGTLDDDLRLSPGSPCIDRASTDEVCIVVDPGSAYCAYAGNRCDFVTDLDDAERYVDDPSSTDCVPPAANCGSHPVIDMGAYEFRPTPAAKLVGDLNCDGVVDPVDAPAFALAVTGRIPYYAAYPACRRSNGDTNDDGILDGADVEGFVGLILGRSIAVAPTQEHTLVQRKSSEISTMPDSRCRSRPEPGRGAGGAGRGSLR